MLFMRAMEFSAADASSPHCQWQVQAAGSGFGKSLVEGRFESFEQLSLLVTGFVSQT
jgi:hypothetical protein